MNWENYDSMFKKCKEAPIVYGGAEVNRENWCTDYNVICNLNKSCPGPKTKGCPAYKEGRPTTTELERAQRREKEIAEIRSLTNGKS